MSGKGIVTRPRRAVQPADGMAACGTTAVFC